MNSDRNYGIYIIRRSANSELLEARAIALGCIVSMGYRSQFIGVAIRPKVNNAKMRRSLLIFFPA